MSVYVLKTMGQDLARARGEEPEALRIETGDAVPEEVRKAYSTEEESEEKPEREKEPKEEMGEPREIRGEKRHEGGVLAGEGEKEKEKERMEPAADEKVPPQEGASILSRIPMLHDRRVLMVISLFLVLMGFGAAAYFGKGIGGAYVEQIRGLFGVNGEKKLSVDLKVPAGGEEWERGKQYRVVWDFEGDYQRKIDIVYLNSGVREGVVAEGVSLGAIEKTWKIPENLETGDEYKLRIMAVEPKEGTSPLLAESSFLSITPYSGADGEATSSSGTSTGTTSTTTTATSTATTTTATSTQSTSSISDFETSPELIDFNKEKTLVLEDVSSPKKRLESLIQEREAEGIEGMERVKFVLPEFEREMKPQRLFEELQMPLPEKIWENLGLNYNFFLYQQKELLAHEKKIRWGVAIETFAPESILEKMIQAETQINSFVQSDSYWLNAGSSAFTDFHTNRKDYSALVRYQNYPKPDLSLDYGVVKTKTNGSYLLITSSRTGMRKLILRIQDRYQLEEFSPKLPDNLNSTAQIRGEICFPDKETPQEWTPKAKNLTTEEIYSGSVNRELGTYVIKNLPTGNYQVYAESQDKRGRYSEAVKCGLGDNCNDHSFVELKLTQGEIKQAINPCDWKADQK